MILVPTLADIEKKSVSAGERSLARLLHGIDTDPNAVAFYSVDLLLVGVRGRLCRSMARMRGCDRGQGGRRAQARRSLVLDRPARGLA